MNVGETSLSVAVLLAAVALASCAPAKLVFGAAPGQGAQATDASPNELGKVNSGALVFFNPLPHLLVTVNKDCTVASQIMMLPGRERQVRLKPGYGSSDLSLGFSNGLITSVGQRSDTKVPETITAVGSLATNLAKVGVLATSPTPDKTKGCPPTARLFPVKPDGTVDIKTDRLAGLVVKQEQ